MAISIPFNKPRLAGHEMRNMAQAVDMQCLSANGAFTKRCEQWLESNLGVRRALLVHSCTAALEMAALLCELQAGDEIILPSYTFVSTANAFALRGCKLVFVDIDQQSLCIDPVQVEQAITPLTKAVVAVHYAGRSCDMQRLSAICRERGVFLIEDAAQSILARYHGQPLGTFGDLSCISFHETKNAMCGEGGALLINNPSFLARSEIIRDKGTNRAVFTRGEVDKYTWIDLGSSYGMSDLLAAFLIEQLEHTGAINMRRQEICLKYHERLSSICEANGIMLPPHIRGNEGNGHIFYLLANDGNQRDELLDFLKQNGIGAVFHYVPLHSSPAGLRYGRAFGSLNVTENTAERLVRLPVFYGLKHDQIDFICQKISEFLEESHVLENELIPSCDLVAGDLFEV